MENRKIIGTGLLTAIAASMCCITPVLALIAGTGGMAASFSWIEPFRPYLIGITAGALGFAWFQILKPKKDVDCDCESDIKTKFTQSKSFLGLVTIFAVVMMAFPSYSGIFFKNNSGQITEVEKSNVNTATFTISGMTCNSCAEHIDREVYKIAGIISCKASYDEGGAIVEFDKSKTNITEIEDAINATGYSVTHSE